MINNHKVVVVTPAGRREYLEILIPYVLRDRDFIDEYQIWANTDKTEDLEYIEFMAKNYPNFIKVIYRDPNIPIPENIAFCIYQFFPNCIEKNTVYIRLDDDIVFIEQDALRKLTLFRIENPQYFLVYGNIINNAICTHLHQRFGAFNHPILSGYLFNDAVGWGNNQFAEEIHNNFFYKFHLQELNDYKFNRWELKAFERMSINVISWLGNEFRLFAGKVDNDEELWLSQAKPSQIQKINCVYGQALFSHYAFHIQRPHLVNTNILQRYRNLMAFLPN